MTVLLLMGTMLCALTACGKNENGKATEAVTENTSTEAATETATTEVATETATTEAATEAATEVKALTMTNEILGEGYEFAYAEEPQKIVSVASPATEMLLALGLEEKIVGYAMQDNEIPEKYKEAFASLNLITEGWDISNEMILALEPDFLMFWNGDASYTYEFLNANGISTYTMLSDVTGAKIESVYEDFRNMGKIFGVEERAEEIISEMEEKIKKAEEKVSQKESVKAAYVDAYSTDEAAFTAGDALVADIFRSAGAENVMNHTEDTWMNISWEEMAASNPEYIVIGVYAGVEDADYWIDFLKNHPAMSEVDAVKNERFVIVGLADLTVGERVADTVGILAEAFHPENQK